MDFRNQPEHEYPLLAEVRVGSDAGVAQELVGGLYNPVPQGMGNVEAIAGGPVLLAPKAPQTSGRILGKGRQEGKQPPLVRGQQLLLCFGRWLRLPTLDIAKQLISLLLFFDLLCGESGGPLYGGYDGGFITH